MRYHEVRLAPLHGGVDTARVQDPLLQRWDDLWRDLDLAPPHTAGVELLAAYGQPHRHYHTVQHLGECLVLLDERVDENATVAVTLERDGGVDAPTSQLLFSATPT